MSIYVYSQERDIAALPPTPDHEITRRLGMMIVNARLGRPFGVNQVILTTSLPWSEIKRLARTSANPAFVDLSPFLPVREYPSQLTCMAEAFQRCMRYPVELAKDQRTFQYSWERERLSA
jgi:hypothetical protein